MLCTEGNNIEMESMLQGLMTSAFPTAFARIVLEVLIVEVTKLCKILISILPEDIANSADIVP